MSKVEELERVGNPDEKDMRRYLNAHDDLQTVLRVYEGVLDGNETLPLKRTGVGSAGGGGGNGGVVAGVGMAGAFDNGVHADSSDDELPAEGAGAAVKKGTRAGGRRSRGGGSGGGGRDSGEGGASSGRTSPAMGNLLDLEENTPLEMGMAGESAGGMMVAYSAGQFSTNHAGGGGGSAAGFDSSSSAAPGSTTASNFPSETGAVYGSNNFGSSNGGGGGDSAAGFGKS